MGEKTANIFNFVEQRPETNRLPASPRSLSWVQDSFHTREAEQGEEVRGNEIESLQLVQRVIGSTNDFRDVTCTLVVKMKAR